MKNKNKKILAIAVLAVLFTGITFGANTFFQGNLANIFSSQTLETINSQLVIEALQKEGLIKSFGEVVNFEIKETGRNTFEAYFFATEEGDSLHEYFYEIQFQNGKITKIKSKN